MAEWHDQMTEAHAFLQSVWETGDHRVLLVLADWLEERGDADFAEILRLTAAEGSTARHSPARSNRLQWLRNDAWRTVQRTAWPEMGIQGRSDAVGFSRRPDPDRPAREHIVVRLGERSVRWLRTDVKGSDEIIATRKGRVLLQRPLPAQTLEFIGGGRDYFWGAGFTLGDDHFPLLDGQRPDIRSALAERRRWIDAALAPAAVPLADLPAELLPYLAWVMCEFLWDKGRRVRGGQVVPGAHLFGYFPGRMVWRHEEAVENRDAEEAAALLHDRFRLQAFPTRPGRVEGAVVAGLLVHVSDDGRTSAQKLVWLGPGNKVRESANLPPRAGATLSEADFRQALGDLRGIIGVSSLQATFPIDTEEKLRALFASQADLADGC